MNEDKPFELLYSNEAPFALSKIMINGYAIPATEVGLVINKDDGYLTLKIDLRRVRVRFPSYDE